MRINTVRPDGDKKAGVTGYSLSAGYGQANRKKETESPTLMELIRMVPDDMNKELSKSEARVKELNERVDASTKSPKRGCAYFRVNNLGEQRCEALQKFYCKAEECPFYKAREQKDADMAGYRRDTAGAANG